MTARKPLETIAANRESANKKRKLRHLWKGELSFEEICEEMAMTPIALLAYAESLGLGERPEIEVYIPTPEQIRLAAAAIRAEWSPAELEARRTPWRGTIQ
jgi:hypothetical protein